MSRGRDVLQRDLWFLPELGSCDLDAFARGTPQAARLPRLFRCGTADWAGTGAMVAESLATAIPSGRVRHGDCTPAGGEQQPIDTRRRVSLSLIHISEPTRR